MAKGRRYTPSAQQKPADAAGGAPHVRAFMLKLFDREDGKAADWPLIAETLLKEAFAALDLAALDPKTAPLAHSIMRRVHAGTYDRLTATPEDAFKDAPSPARSAPLLGYDGPQHHPADRPDAPLAR